MVTRLPLSVGFAGLVTFGLFWLMQALVSVSWEPLPPSTSLKIEITRLIRDTEPEKIIRKPPRPTKPEPPPITPTPASTLKLDPGAAIAGLAPPVEPALPEGSGGGGGVDRDAVPRVRIEPEYPLGARQRGTEGWVTLAFTITKLGTVENVVVRDSHPGSIFDRAAIRAVERWRYDPKILNGEAVDQPGSGVTLEFTLED